MKLKKVIFWIIFGVIAYILLDYTHTHTRNDVLSYKRFADAVLKGDDFLVRTTSMGPVAAQVSESQEARQELLGGAKRVFTYYRILDRNVTDDGKFSFITAEQVSRVNPEGFDTVWGEVAVRIRHTVKLEAQNHSWRVVQFSDPARQP